jgi:hypothetical protein
VVFHPEGLAMQGIRFTSREIRAEIERRIASHRLASTSAAEKPDDNVYILMLIRPQGITAYYTTIAALSGLSVDFGYEMIDRDWILDFSESNTNPQPWMKPAEQPALVRSPGGSTKSMHGLQAFAPDDSQPPPPSIAQKSETTSSEPSGVSRRLTASAPAISLAKRDATLPPNDATYPTGFRAIPAQATLAQDASLTHNAVSSSVPLGGFPRQIPANATIGAPQAIVPAAPKPTGVPSPAAADNTPLETLRVPVTTSNDYRPYGTNQSSVQPPVGAENPDRSSPLPPLALNNSERDVRSRPVQSDSSDRSAQPPSPGTDRQDRSVQSPSSGLQSRDANGDRTPNADGPPPDPLTRLMPADPKKRPPRPLPFTGLLNGNRDWIITIECRADGVMLLPARQQILTAEFSQSANMSNPLRDAIEQMIARRQASLRAGEPPYRPMIRFRVWPDGMRAYYGAYPALEPLGLPMTRENPDMEEKKER